MLIIMLNGDSIVADRVYPRESKLFYNINGEKYSVDMRDVNYIKAIG